MQIDAYRNLTKNCYSILDRATGRVHMHAKALSIIDPTFIVQPKGNARVRATGQKNVHAFVRGKLFCSGDSIPIPANARRATYNPMEFTSFVDVATCSPIVTAELAWLTPDGLYYRPGAHRGSLGDSLLQSIA